MSSNPALTTIAVPQDSVDQIIFTGTYSFTATDVVGSTTTFLLPETFPGESLPQAIFSFDSGNSWQDAGTPVVYFNQSAAIARAWCYAYPNTSTTPGKIEFQYIPTAQRNGGVPYTVQIKVAVALNPNLTSYDNSISRFTGQNAYSSNNQYLKIAAQGIWTPPGSTTGASITIPHNLGYVPFVSVFLKETLGVYALASIINTGTSPVGDPLVYADETNLYITISTGTSYELYYKIYSKG